MKKNISINIGGIIFHIEEDGYEKLKNYLDSVNKYFSTFEDSKEIIEDIEGRIAEIFLNRLEDGNQVISQEDVDDLIAIMGTTKDFDATIEAEEEEKEAERETTDSGEEREEATKEDRKLYRDRKRRVIGGVAAGIAHYFKIDPIWVRLIILAFFFTIVLSPFSGFILIAYIIFWIAIPGSDTLEEDKAIKKLFRDPEDRVLGGVCSGLALYFGVDRGLIRILFVIAIFFGAGILAYIILWIIVPEAKTITEKMQMQGEPVTISNIEESVKKSLNVKEGEESPLVKVLLFPFRLLALIFKTLGDLLGPFLKFAVEALRIAVGVFFVFLGFVLMIAATISLIVLLGIGGAMESWVQFGSFPPEYLIGTLSTITIISAYLVMVIPSLALSILGISIIVKKAVVKAFVGWSLFGLWLLGLIGLAFSVPALLKDFRTENNIKEERIYERSPDVIPTLAINDNDPNFEIRYDDVELRLRGHSDSVYRLVLDVEARGSSRSNAKENARMVSYTVEQRGDQFIFNSHLTFENETPFRFQNLRATFYIPYDQEFKMEEDLADILINTLHLNGYRAYQMEGNTWVFDEDGINCLTCKNDRSKEYSSRRSRRRGGSDIQTFEFDDFDEVKITSMFDFEIRKGDGYKVELEGDDDELDKVSIEQSGDELEINNAKRWKWWRDKEWRNKIKVFVIMPELDQLTVNGACEGEVSGFDNDEISFNIEGASEIKADINSKSTYVDLAGASELTLEGSTEDLEADVLGASKLRAYDFIAEEVDIRAIGASTARVYANRELEAEASGASTIRYRGNAIVSSNSNGLSSIKKD